MIRIDPTIRLVGELTILILSSFGTLSAQLLFGTYSYATVLQTVGAGCTAGSMTPYPNSTHASTSCVAPVNGALEAGDGIVTSDINRIQASSLVVLRGFAAGNATTGTAEGGFFDTLTFFNIPFGSSVVLESQLIASASGEAFGGGGSTVSLTQVVTQNLRAQGSNVPGECSISSDQGGFTACNVTLPVQNGSSVTFYIDTSAQVAVAVQTGGPAGGYSRSQSMWGYLGSLKVVDANGIIVKNAGIVTASGHVYNSQ